MATAPESASIADRIRHPLLKLLFEYWQSLCDENGIARKSRFDPVEVPGALWSRLHLIDIGDDTASSRNRLLGTYVVDAVGMDFTGRHLTDDQIPGVSHSITYRLLQRLKADSQPQHYFGAPSFILSAHLAMHEQLLLPLADDTGRITTAIGALDYPGFEPGFFQRRDGH